MNLRIQKKKKNIFHEWNSSQTPAASNCCSLYHFLPKYIYSKVVKDITSSSVGGYTPRTTITSWRNSFLLLMTRTDGRTLKYPSIFSSRFIPCPTCLPTAAFPPLPFNKSIGALNPKNRPPAPMPFPLRTTKNVCHPILISLPSISLERPRLSIY